MEAQGVPAEPNERDSTDEWRIAPARSLTSVAELEGRIDVALATARSAEEAALEIGAASLEAAEQARRAAALAERASASAARAAESAREASVRSIRSAPSVLAADVPVGTIEPAEVGSSPASAAPIPATAEPAAADAPAVTDTATPSLLDLPTAGASNGATARRPDPFEDRIAAFRLRAEKVMIRLQKIEAGAPSHQPTEVVRLSN
jgi:hypothetical protein